MPSPLHLPLNPFMILVRSLVSPYNYANSSLVAKLAGIAILKCIAIISVTGKIHAHSLVHDAVSKCRHYTY